MRHAPILILDDSFSALDYATDARLRAALKRESRDTTVVIVAQRVSSIMDADKIIVLDEDSSWELEHSELMETCSTYQEIVNSQLSVDGVA